MAAQQFQLTMKFPKSKGGRFVAVLKTARANGIATIIGTGQSAMAAKVDAERQLLALGHEDHAATKFLTMQREKQVGGDVPF